MKLWTVLALVTVLLSLSACVVMPLDHRHRLTVVDDASITTCARSMRTVSVRACPSDYVLSE